MRGTAAAKRGGARARRGSAGARIIAQPVESRQLVSPPATGGIAARRETEAAGAVSGEPILPLAEVEREAVERAIRLCGGNLSLAAQKLGINVSTIHRKRRVWSAGVEG